MLSFRMTSGHLCVDPSKHVIQLILKSAAKKEGMINSAFDLTLGNRESLGLAIIVSFISQQIEEKIRSKFTKDEIM